MINIMKSDINRLFKSKGFWFSLGIFIIISISTILLLISAQNSSMMNSSDGSLNITASMSIKAVLKNSNSFATLFGHSFGSLVLGIYLAIFVCNEYSSGYIKNIATLSNGRIAIIISKVVVAAIIDLIIILLSYILGFILGNVLVDKFVVDSLDVILKSSLVMFVMTLALFSIVIVITTLFRNKIAGIILVLLISSGMLQPFFTSLFDIINLTFLSDYTLTSLFQNTALVEENIFIRVILASIFYIIVYNSISIGISLKRDI